MDYIFLLSRVIFGGYFVMSGYGHLRHLPGTTGYAASKRVPMPKLAVIGTGILMILSGLGIISGILVTYAVGGIVLFLFVVSFKMHAFWKEVDPGAKMNEKIHFTKNMAVLAGALAYLSVSTPWPMSF